MQGHFFLQNMVDAMADYVRSPTSGNEMKAFNAYLSAEEHGYGRQQLNGACVTVERLLLRNLNKILL